jgi:hypothetical protein
MGGRRLHPLVREKPLHVAVATVAARALDIEVAETLIFCTQRFNDDRGTAADAQGA